MIPPGALAQLGERRLCKPEVTGSIPVRSIGESLETGSFSCLNVAAAGDEEAAMEALWKRRGARVRLWHGDGLVANPRGHPESLRLDARPSRTTSMAATRPRRSNPPCSQHLVRIPLGYFDARRYAETAWLSQAAAARSAGSARRCCTGAVPISRLELELLFGRIAWSTALSPPNVSVRRSTETLRGR